LIISYGASALELCGSRLTFDTRLVDVAVGLALFCLLLGLSHPSARVPAVNEFIFGIFKTTLMKMFVSDRISV
jgi:hypothetical protein